MWLAYPMSNELIAIIVTAVLAVSALTWTVLGLQRMRGNRHLLRGLGLTLLPIGLWLTGLMELMVQGVRGVVDFFGHSSMDTMMIAGIVVAALGLLLFILASAIKPVSREESRERRLARSQRETPAVGRSRAAREAATPTTDPRDQRQQAKAAPAKAKGLDDEDAEIEALLRKRGIE